MTPRWAARAWGVREPADPDPMPHVPSPMPAFPDHFSSHAANYARYRPTYPAQLFDWIATSAPGRGTAWDCACGNGQATLPLAERFERVIATDPSAEQIARQRRA